MAEHDARAFVRRHLATKPGSERSTHAWTYDLDAWLEFCDEHDVDALRPKRGEFQDYLVELRSDSLAPSTTRRRMRSAYDFLIWLFREGTVESDPHHLSDLLPDAPKPEVKHLYSLEEISALVNAAGDDAARAGLLLLTVCFLTPSELEAAEMDHLTEVEGRPALRIPSRDRLDLVVVPEVVDEAIRTAAGTRARGPLVLNRAGARPDRQAQQRWINAARKRAGLSTTITPMILNLSARKALMEAGVSFGAVARGVPPLSSSYLKRHVIDARRPISEHPAYRMARLLGGDNRSQSSLMDQAETLAHQDDLDPIAAVAVAGAALERHLRALAADRGVEIASKEPNLGLYATRLYAEGAILLHHKKRLDVLADIRNNADHGWVDRVTRAQAFDMIDDTRSIMHRYPVAEPR